jgi:hypothetical protein
MDACKARQGGFVGQISLDSQAVGCVFCLAGLRGLLRQTLQDYGVKGDLYPRPTLSQVQTKYSAVCSTPQDYGVKEDLSTTNVVLGTVLMLPTVICWLQFMESMGLFSVAAATAPLAPKSCH